MTDWPLRTAAELDAMLEATKEDLALLERMQAATTGAERARLMAEWSGANDKFRALLYRETGAYGLPITRQAHTGRI